MESSLPREQRKWAAVSASASSSYSSFSCVNNHHFLSASRQYTVVMEFLFFVTVVNLVCFSQSGVLAESLKSRSEFDALYSLRGSLGIQARDWPRRNDPCAKWKGVHCEDGRVIGLTLTGLHRTKRGNASASFAVDGLRRLTRLSSFISTDFSLPGAIPDWFGTSGLNDSLTVIDICRASINGSLPDSLGYLKRLKILKLSSNQLNGVIPENLGHLKELRVIDMSLNRLTGSIPMSMGKLSKLHDLDLSSNFLNGLIPPKLMNLPNLKSLVLSKNNLNGSIPGMIGDSSLLITLDLSHNNLSGPFPVELNSTQSLKFLNLGSNFLSGALLGDIFINLPNLTSLVLSHNNFSDAIPKSFWALSNMQLIDVSYNNFTGILPKSFAKNPNASVLEIDLSHNFYYDHLPVGTEKLIKNLRHLDISHNYFDGDMKFRKGDNATVLQNCFTGEDVIDQRSKRECRMFYDSIGVEYDEPEIPSPTPSPTPSPSPGKKNNWPWYYSLAISLVALSLVVLLGLVIWCSRRHEAVSAENETHGRGFPQISSASFPSSVDSITYDKIQKATLNFNANLFMKKGHSGELYHGNLENGTPIVVKKIDHHVAEKELYLVELDVFTRVLHTRLAPYLGHCLNNESEKYIIYKYLPNLDLATAFYIKSTQDEDEIKSLDWITRQKIAIGVAEALVYLHHECVPPIVHRDVQASSILLDDKFEVRLGSLSEACTQEIDGQSNVITRLFRPSQPSGTSSSGSKIVTPAYDIYCFGKVLLELVTGRLGISACDETSLNEKFAEIMPYINLSEKDQITNIIDPTLIVAEDLIEEVLAMAIVAKSCLNPKASRRPPIKAVLKVLQNPLKVTREESISGSSRIMISSQGSWNMSLFGSWRSISEMTTPVPVKEIPDQFVTAAKKSPNEVHAEPQTTNAVRLTKSLERIQAANGLRNLRKVMRVGYFSL